MQVRTILLATAVLSVSLAARADVIIDNLANAGTYYSPIGVSSYESIGVAFTPGTDEPLTETQVLVIHNPALPASSNNNFDELLFSNSGGAPGTLIATLGTDLAAPSSAGIVDVSGLSVALTAGDEYWFVLAPHDSTSDIGWEENGAALPVAADPSWSSGWFSTGVESSGQFALYSTPASVTPEPSSLALLGTGLLSIGGVIRKRFA